MQGVDAAVQKVGPYKWAVALPEPLCPLRTLGPKMFPKPGSPTGAQSPPSWGGLLPRRLRSIVAYFH